MSLANAAANYINSWEGHTSNEGTNLSKFLDVLKKSPVDDIMNEYNALSTQHLWNEPLVDLFHDELLYRIMTATFVISTGYRSISTWLTDPFVEIKIGFEDEYPVLLTTAPLDQGVSTLVLTSDTFYQKNKEDIIRIIMGGNVIINCDVGMSRIRFKSIENVNDPIEKVVFPNLDAQSQTLASAQTISVIGQIIEDPEFTTIRRLIDGLKNETYPVIDPLFEETAE